METRTILQISEFNYGRDGYINKQRPTLQNDLKWVMMRSCH